MIEINNQGWLTSGIVSSGLKKIGEGVCLIATIVAIPVMAQNQREYGRPIPDEMYARMDNEENNDMIIKESLVSSIYKKYIDINSLNKISLAGIAQKTNAASILHCSGNCVLLAGCILYNLKVGEMVLGGRNTFPIHKGVNQSALDRIIFGGNLITVEQNIDSIELLEHTLISTYQETGERFYIIKSGGYRVPLLGDCGHDFNAVILFDKNKKPYVQFVDAWKTSNYTPSSDELAAHYNNVCFSIVRWDRTPLIGCDQ